MTEKGYPGFDPRQVLFPTVFSDQNLASAMLLSASVIRANSGGELSIEISLVNSDQSRFVFLKHLTNLWIFSIWHCHKILLILKVFVKIKDK